MGQVYKVQLPEDSDFVALKLLKPTQDLITQMGMKWVTDQFEHEFSVIAPVRHENVAKVWGLKNDGSDVYYLMDYFPRNLGVLMGESYWADRPTRILPMGKEKKLKVCRDLDDLFDALITEETPRPILVRHEPDRVLAKHAKRIFCIDDLQSSRTRLNVSRFPWISEIAAVLMRFSYSRKCG